MMNVVVLMAGSDQAFIDEGYKYPKNLVEIAGKPLLQRILENLTHQKTGFQDAKFICMVKDIECKNYHTDAVIKLTHSNAELFPVYERTKGAACTALLAIDKINNDQPLVIVNGDILHEINLRQVITDFEKRELDGGVIVFKSIHPRWSYVKIDEHGLVIEASEKRPISHFATTGLYYFKHGSDFISSAMEMIYKDANIDDAFYVCPAYNQMILAGKKIGIYPIEQSCYRSLALPQDVKEYDAFLKKTGDTAFVN